MKITAQRTLIFVHAVDFVRPAVFTTSGSTMIAFGEGTQDRYAPRERGMS